MVLKPTNERHLAINLLHGAVTMLGDMCCMRHIVSATGTTHRKLSPRRYRRRGTFV